MRTKKEDLTIGDIVTVYNTVEIFEAIIIELHDTYAIVQSVDEGEYTSEYYSNIYSIGDNPLFWDDESY